MIEDVKEVIEVQAIINASLWHLKGENMTTAVGLSISHPDCVWFIIRRYFF